MHELSIASAIVATVEAGAAESRDGGDEEEGAVRGLSSPRVRIAALAVAQTEGDGEAETKAALQDAADATKKAVDSLNDERTRKEKVADAVDSAGKVKLADDIKLIFERAEA